MKSVSLVTSTRFSRWHTSHNSESEVLFAVRKVERVESAVLCRGEDTRKPSRQLRVDEEIHYASAIRLASLARAP